MAQLSENIKEIDRRYQVVSQLGSGLSGEIFKVQGPEGVAALKLLRTEVPGLNQEDLIATFKFEFSLLKGLKHPNVISIFDFGFDESLKRFYFTQEMVEGGASLKELAPKAPVETIQKLLIQALQGLAYLHSHEVIHGDIKPDNLLVTKPKSDDPGLKVIDFGISHPSFVQVAGTPTYMAPEKILKEPTDARSDLYSLGVVFYSILTGKNPFERESVPETLRAHLTFVPSSATSHRPELDPVWSELISLMLKKNPRHRINSAEACLKFLDTKGNIDVSITRPRLLPEGFMGRKEIFDEAKGFLEEVAEQKTKSLLLVVGEKGLGKESLLRELKYEAELKEIDVLAPGEESQRQPSILFLKPGDVEEYLSPNKVSRLLKQQSLVMGFSSETYESLPKSFPTGQAKVLKLRPLNQDEVQAYLKTTTRNQEIPGPFLSALYRYSGGYPAQLQEALRSLLKDPLIVDPSGKWNLAVFHEVEPTLEQLGLSESSLARALASPLVEDPKERWHLQLRRTIGLVHQGKLEEALQLLQDLEKELSKPFKGTERLTPKAYLLEKRGWIYTKQNRLSEAREAFASGLSLLAESEEAPLPLEIRLKNFIAYLDLQAGKISEAIEQFEKNAKQAEELDEEEQRVLTNNELGSAYLAAERYEEAIKRIREELEFYATLPDPSFEMKASYNLAEAYFRIKKYPEALQAYGRVAEIGRKERQWDYLIRAYNGLGNTASLQKDRLKSLDYYQRSLSLAEYSRDYISAATVAQNRGVILNELNRLEEALHDLDLSKRLIGKVPSTSHSRYLMARATLELGEVFLKKRDHQKARNFFTEALNRAEEDPNLKSFRFYPLASLAGLALEEREYETFRELYPKLIHQAQGEEEKKILSDLLLKAPEDPRQGIDQEASPQKKVVSDITHSWIPKPAESSGALLSILNINRALITEHNLDQLFQKILQYASELSGAESVLLLEVMENNELAVRMAFNTEVDQAQKEISQTVARKVLETGESIVTHDAQVDKDFNQYQSVISLHLRSIACIPIRLYQKTIGLLYLTHRNKAQCFSQEIIQILEAFGDQAGLAMQNARHLQQLNNLNQQLKGQLDDAELVIDQLKTDLRAKVKNPYPKILGKSRAIVEILQLLDRISDTNLAVLILGETGSGKELVAHSIHDNSRRSQQKFIAVNCGAIPENLMESELFGYVAGAFTGANRDKRGLLEEANGGTLFLDEVAELPLNLQVKLLRAVQEKEILRLGSNQVTPVDIRLIAATHRNLEEWVEQGKFREDLFYRLAQMILSVPSLRERLEDLPLLTEHFLKQSAKEMGIKKPLKISKTLLHLMMDYGWPGNVRELENLIRAAVPFAERGAIHPANLPAFLQKKLSLGKKAAPMSGGNGGGASATGGESTALPFQEGWTWRQYEEALFAKALLKFQMDCEKVAEVLGVGIATVYVKIRKYDLKSGLDSWRDSSINFPEGTTVAQLKQWVIQKTYETKEKSPYAVAKQLDLNVGTIYRHLKN